MGAGRPPKYTSRDEVDRKIDEYFESRKGEVALDDDGKPVFNKYGEPCYIKPPRPPTITGIALYLGFNSKQTLYEYGKKDEFADSILRARSKVEEYAEERLYDKDGQRGAEFNLRCNFGWKPEDGAKNDVEQTRIVDDV